MKIAMFVLGLIMILSVKINQPVSTQDAFSFVVWVMAAFALMAIPVLVP
jgi:hypothetical protein